MLGFFGSKAVVHAIGLDIGPSAIKVVQLRLEKEKIFLETYGEIATGPYSGFEPGQSTVLGDEKILEAIGDLFKAAKVTTKNAGISIESSGAFISLIQVPTATDEELSRIIPLEARKYLPLPVAEVQLDFWRVPKGNGPQTTTDEKRTDIVLAAVTNVVIEKYQRYATSLGLEKPVFEVEGFSALRSTLHEKGLILFVDMGSDYTTLTLVRDGIIFDMHTISKGSLMSTMQLSQALSVPVAVAEEAKRKFGYTGDSANPYLKEVMKLSSYPLFGEIARLLLMYERKYNQVIDGIIIGGGGARTPGILETFHESVQTKARIATPFDQVEVPEFLKGMINNIGPSYTVACGLALKKLLSSK